ncbi:unnamed protein product [Chrysoparadoxa australica]
MAEVDGHAHLEGNAAFMDKYSRQIGAFGLEAMAKLQTMKVLIVGLQGLGMEVAKNLVLAGPGAVTLHDDEPTQIKNLAGNFYLSESNVGHPRAAAVVAKLQELNSMVAVKVAQGALTEPVVQAHTCVVWCNGTREDLARWNSYCRSHKITFIATGAAGAMGYVFSDFGDNFTVRDSNGETPATRIITNISNEEEGVVTLLGAAGEEGGRMHGMEENDHDGWVEISDVEGMDGFQGTGAIKIKTCEKTVHESVKQKDGTTVQKEKKVYDPYRLQLACDTRKFGTYENGGVLTQVKVPVVKHHRSFESCAVKPVGDGEWGLLFTDGAKFGRAEQLHLALLALWEFQQGKGRYPVVGDEAEAAEVVALAKAINEQHTKLNEATEGSALALEVVDEACMKQVAMFAAAEVQPLGAYFGGVVAQEIVKATGKYTPLNQWLHIDFLEVLPSERADDCQPLGTRYDDLITIYGRRFVEERIMNGKTFMVGCGALGCEFLKNFALLGFACGPDGLITVTDNDRIEISNLNRQFLFRDHNVGQPKSTAAASAVTNMNPSIKVEAKEALVAPHTENLFPDSFWESLDLVTNALDNVKARLYVDSRCVFYGKPLLESGTLGTKCNVQVVVPHLTASYADGPKDQADEDNIPMCTLRNFPSLIEHCIEWARAQFEDFFVVPFGEAKKFVSDRDDYLQQIKKQTVNCPDKGKAASAIAKALEELTELQSTLTKAKGMTFAGCIAQAQMMFFNLFHSKIRQLIHNFPEDHTTKDGEKFWTGGKKFPRAADLDAACAEHMNFIISAANILAACYGVVPPPEQQLLPADHPQRSVEMVGKELATLDVPMWEPTNEKIDLEEGNEAKESKEEEADDTESMLDEGETIAGAEAERELTDLLAQLQEMDLEGVQLEPADFEKDQDLNCHIDFISATCNIRAWNYRIKEASRHKCKMIAGKIIPAIATTTASVCGLVMVEMLKILQGKPLEAFKDSSNNLGLNSYFFSEPAPPEKAKDEYDPINMAEVKCIPTGFTKWDRTVINKGDLTMRQFLEAFKEVTGLNCTLLFHGVSEIDGPQRGLMLYDAEAWNPKLKAVYAAQMDSNLRSWVAERYANAPVEIMVPSRTHVELQVSCSDDSDDPCKVPSVVYRWAP